MAKVDFDAIGASKNSANKPTGPYIGFISFKDKQGNPVQPVVRFPYGTACDFDLVTVHTIKIGERFKAVNCLTDRSNPNAKCPFCENAEKVGKASLRFIIKLVEYVTDENGNIVPVAKTWNAPFKVAKDLKALMEEYGDLKNWVFKIKQQKDGGQTSYVIIPTRQDVYTEAKYPIDFSAFEQTDALKFQVINRTAEEMQTFVDTGSFPVREYKQPEPTVSKNLDRIDTTGAEEALNIPARPVRQETVTTEDIPQRPRRYTY